jgi:hypothetical protein
MGDGAVVKSTTQPGLLALMAFAGDEDNIARWLP